MAVARLTPVSNLSFIGKTLVKYDTGIPGSAPVERLRNVDRDISAIKITDAVTGTFENRCCFRAPYKSYWWYTCVKKKLESDWPVTLPRLFIIANWGDSSFLLFIWLFSYQPTIRQPCLVSSSPGDHWRQLLPNKAENTVSVDHRGERNIFLMKFWTKANREIQGFIHHQIHHQTRDCRKWSV